MRMRRSPIVSRCFDPVTVPAAPRKVNEAVTGRLYSSKGSRGFSKGFRMVSGVVHEAREDLLSALRSGATVVGAELRPPRAELESGEGMDAWIDTYHAVR